MKPVPTPGPIQGAVILRTHCAVPRCPEAPTGDSSLSECYCCFHFMMLVAGLWIYCWDGDALEIAPW